MKRDAKNILLTTLPLEKAQSLQHVLDGIGVKATLQNTNMIQPFMSSGVKVKIPVNDKVAVTNYFKDHPEAVEKFEISTDALLPPHKILVPVDFSEYSCKAAVFAFNLAVKKNASVTLLHAYFTPFFPGTFPDSDTFNSEIQEEEMSRELQQRLQDESRKFSSRLKAKILAGQLPDVPFNFEITEGIPEEEINRWSRQNKPDMIVMGTRGKDQKEIDLIGSVTAEVIDTTQVPVFAIPENTAVRIPEDIHKLGFVTSFDPRDQLALERLKAISPLTGKEIVFIYLIPKDKKMGEKALAAAREYYEKTYPEQSFSFLTIHEEQLLKDTDTLIRDSHIDVLVLTTHKRNIFARLFNPSIAHKMVFHSDTPLLIIRN